uniref:DUF4333 domain-containing protein n=1 Tax=Gordonia sp. B7-2 TaxID=3420932 RepID=UPI003D9175BF
MSEPNNPPAGGSNVPGSGQPGPDNADGGNTDGKTEVVNVGGAKPAAPQGPPADPTTVSPAPGSVAPPTTTSQTPPPGYPQQPGYGAPQAPPPPQAGPGGQIPGQYAPTQMPGQYHQGQAPGTFGAPPQGGEPSGSTQQIPPGQYGSGQYPGAQPGTDPNATQHVGGGYGQPSGPQGTGQPQGAPGYGAASFGQPTYGQQPYGQPGQQPPGQFGGDQFASMAKQGSSGKGLRLAMIIGGAVLFLAAIVIVVTAFWLPGWAPKTLDQAAVESGVEKVLTEDYQATEVKDVSCPSGQKIEQGASFTCTLTVGDQENQQVTVTVLDDEGKYEVSRPGPKT